MARYLNSDTPHGHIYGRITQLKQKLISERVKSELAIIRKRASNSVNGRGGNAKSGRLAPKALWAMDNGRSYRWIARDLNISKISSLTWWRMKPHKAL